ncbi:MAG TPA: universal stress protein [Solirubrobacteraceae bacterium]
MTEAERIEMPRREPGGGPCVILGYDRGESARHAASWATSELMSSGKLVIVHACRPLHTLPVPPRTPGEHHQLERALLDELMLDGDERLFDVDFAIEVSDEDPVTALIDAARDHRARAIVIGARHHSRLFEALGTTTGELLRTSPVAVITVPLSAVSGRAPTPSTVAGRAPS